MLPTSRALSLLLMAPLSLLAAACGGGGATGSGGGATTSTASTSTTSETTTGTGSGGTGGSGGSMQTGGGGAGGSVPKAPYHLVGRFDDSDPARPQASWSGTTFRTRVSGPSLSISLGGAKDIRFQIEIDGQSTGTFTTSGGDKLYEVATGLSSGEHDVVIVRRNEGFFGDVAFLGFEPGPGAALVETAWPYAHDLELIGDSLTAGYGIEGPNASCNFSGGTESYYGTYGAVAARQVNAAVHAIAYSGKGVFQNYGGDKNELMPALWRRTLTNDPGKPWDFSKRTPEAVVINLGTNDFSASIAQSDFVGAYVGLLGDVRKEYPSALIFCVTWAHWGGAHEGWVKSAMTTTGDANLRHVGFSIDPADGLGCDSHTNLVTNGKLGAVLAQALHDELGW